MTKGEELKRDVLDCELCTTCGTCVGVCPTKAYDTENNRIIFVKDKCIDCGKCVVSCPGKDFSFHEWSGKITGKPYDKNNKFGNYKNIYKVQSNEKKIKENSASGGAVTQICLALLRSGKIDGVVSVREKIKVPYVFEPFLAQTEEEIIKSAQSKYSLIPTNSILGLLRNTNKKIAFVGLPCQVQGLRKAMEKEKWLRESIVVVISLFCGFNMDYAATEYLIKKSGISHRDIMKLRYRQKIQGQTGFYIKSKSGKEFFVPKHGYTFMNLIFSPKRCWKCFDYSGEFADISVGDAWEKKGGCSRVVVRTQKGKEIIDFCHSNQSIEREECFLEDFIQTQKKVVAYKKEQIYYRKKYMKTFPHYKVEFEKPENGMKGLVLYFILIIFKTRMGKGFIKLLPFKILVHISKAIKGNEIK